MYSHLPCQNPLFFATELPLIFAKGGQSVTLGCYMGMSLCKSINYHINTT